MIEALDHLLTAVLLFGCIGTILLLTLAAQLAEVLRIVHRRIELHEEVLDDTEEVEA